MGKFSKLLIIGTGIAVGSYYSKNKEKLNEHSKILKNKLSDSIGYTKCMINYTKENGVEEAVNYLYNDAKKVAKRTKDSVEEKINDTVAYGKELANNMDDIKLNASNISSYSKEIKVNLEPAKKVIDELKPVLKNYTDNLKNSLNNIQEKTQDIKEDVESSNISGKIENFTKESTETISTVKEKVDKEVLKGQENE